MVASFIISLRYGLRLPPRSHQNIIGLLSRQALALTFFKPHTQTADIAADAFRTKRRPMSVVSPIAS